MKKTKLIGILLVSCLCMSLAVTVVRAEDLDYKYIWTHDKNLNVDHATYGYHRTPEESPSGQWYTNVNFDPDPSNYAVIADGVASLRAYSYATFWPKSRGWSNAYFSQGRPLYSGGIYEGKFRGSDSTEDEAVHILGRKYSMSTIEPTGELYLQIGVKVTRRNVNQWFAFASVLFFATFQYEFSDGLSLYDSPPKTNCFQSVHYDIFFSRCRKTFGWYSEDPVGLETWDWGDAYNDDLHVQYVAGTMSNVGQYYYFSVDWGFLMNICKELINDACDEMSRELINDENNIQGVPPIRRPISIILRWIGVSDEVIGSELEVEIDYVRFSRTP